MEKDKMIVSHSNKITESIFSMNKTQINIFITLIYKLKHKEGKVSLDSSEIKKLCLKDRSDITFKEHLEVLQDKRFRFNEGSLYRSIVPFPTLDFDIKTGTVEVRINKDLDPYTRDLKEQFTKYSLKEFLGLGGTYPKRIYQLLKQYGHCKKRTITILSLKEVLEADKVKSYDRFENFEARVIKKSIEEINKKTTMKVKYKKIKRGRSIQSIEFNWTEKNTTTFSDNKKSIETTTTFNKKNIDKAIQKAKKNIYVSKSWNKRTDNKIQKVYSDLGEEFTVSLLNKLYDNLQQEVKTTLVQYIKGITKNMELEKEEIQEKEEKKKKNITPKQLQGVGVSKGKSEELKKELTEEDQTPEQIKNSLLGKIQIKEGIRPFTPEGKKEIKLLDALSIKELEKRLNRTDIDEKKEEPYVLPERSQRKKTHLERLVSEIKSDLDFYGTGYKGVRKKADLVEILLDTEDRYNN